MKFFSESVFSLCVAALAVFAACDDDRPSDKTGQRVPLQLNVAKPDGTRLDGTQWEEGDQIGVYLLDANGAVTDGGINVRYIVNTDGSCHAANADSMIFLDEDASYMVTAYYPYSAEAAASNTHILQVDNWNQPDNQSALDVLCGSVNGISTSASNAAIPLARQCTRLFFSFAASDADVNLHDLSVTLSNKNTKMIFDILECTWHENGTTQLDPIQLAVSVNDEGTSATASAIVPSSGIFDDGIPVLTMTLSDNDVRTYTFPDDFTFEMGKQYSWNISLSPGLDIDAIVEQILNMTESGTVVASGYAHDPDAAIERIKEALGTLATNSPDVFVTLDMSGVIGMTSIGSYAFKDCSALAGITIPSGVTSIGYGAFMYCDGLTSIEIPSGVTSIDWYAFQNCSSLTSIEIPSSVTRIGRLAFDGCTGLASIEIPSSVTSIGVSAFRFCTGLTSIVVASGNSVYDSRNNCNAIIVTASNTLIAGCQNTVIPSGVTSIGESAFDGCTGLASIEIPSGVTSIGKSAFGGCTGLASIEIPSGVTTIGNYAFMYCDGLTSIEIPSSVTSIGNMAFSGCSNLTTVYYTGTEADRDNMTIDDETITGSGVTWYYNYDGHPFVDLGLPNGLLWATCNVGASKPEGYGNYYAWGETTGYDEGKTLFDWTTYTLCGGTSTTLTKYCVNASEGTVDNITTLDLSDDAAHANWGGNWRMPTNEEWTALFSSDYTTYEMITVNGVYGLLITSKTNGNSIFLPAAGVRSGDVFDSDATGNYLSSSIAPAGFVPIPSYLALGRSFSSEGVQGDYMNRCNGLSVRAVRVP